MKDRIIDEKGDYKDIGLHGFDYKLFEEEEGEVNRYGLYGYPYLKYLIQFWPGDRVEQIAKINEAVGMKNIFIMDGGRKRLVFTFKSQEVWKFIGCILSEVTYGKEGHNIWSEITRSSYRMSPTKLRRDVGGNTDLYKVCFDHYRRFYTCACHLIIYLTQFIHLFDVSLSNYLSFSLTGLRHIVDKF